MLPRTAIRTDRQIVLRPFKKALHGGAANGELDLLIESVPGVGLRLDLPGSVQVVGSPETRTGDPRR